MQECCWGIIDQILPPGPERKGQSVSLGRPVKDVPTQNMQGKKKKGQEQKSASLIGCIALQIGKEIGGEIRNRRKCRNPRDRQTDVSDGRNVDTCHSPRLVRTESVAWRLSACVERRWTGKEDLLFRS